MSERAYNRMSFFCLEGGGYILGGGGGSISGTSDALKFALTVL